MRRDLNDDQRRASLLDLEDLEATHWKNRHTLASETVAEPSPEISVVADKLSKHMGESPRTSHKQASSVCEALGLSMEHSAITQKTRNRQLLPNPPSAASSPTR
jgi:hypothetical protein